MIETVKKDIENVADNLAKLSRDWEKMDDHEREHLEITAEQADFSYEIESLFYDFRRFRDWSKRVTVVNGVQAYIDDYDMFQVILQNKEYGINNLIKLRSLVKSQLLEPNTALKLVEMYLKGDIE